MDYPALTEALGDQHHRQLYDPSELQSSGAYDPCYAAVGAAGHHPQPPDRAPHPPPPTARGDLSPMSPVLHHQQNPELNPAAAAAAAAAFSQLSEFAGTMDVAERAMVGVEHAGMMHPSHPLPLQQGADSIHPAIGGGSPYRGGGRRVGGPFRGGGGGGRGNTKHPHSWMEGGAPFRGRGRGRKGRGGCRGFYQPAPNQSSSYAPAEAVESSLAPAPAALTIPLLPQLPLLPTAWCDVCRVDCTSKGVLETHKNGKRHKRTVQRMEHIEAQQKLMAELQTKVTATPEMALGVVGNTSAPVGTLNKVSAAPETMPDAALVNENMEPEQQSQTVNRQSSSAKAETEAPAPEATPSEELPGMDDTSNSRGGLKRNMVRFGRGGKRMKCSEPVCSRPPERLKEQTRVCTLCNAVCDTLTIFECHLAGKKHVSRIKRLQGPDTVYGPVNVYIPPNQPSLGTAQATETLFYGLTHRDMLQQEGYGYNGTAVESSGHWQGVLAEQAKDAVLEPQVEQALKYQENEVPAIGGQEALTSNSEGQNAVEEPKSNEHSASPLASVPETASMDAGVAFAVAMDGLHAPGHGVFPAGNVLPGLAAKVESSANIEELDSGVMGH